MFHVDRKQRGAAVLGMALAVLSFAPAPPDAAERPRAQFHKMAESRYQAAVRAYEESWVYYRQARTDPFFTYSWSRIVMVCQADLSDKKEDQLAAMQGHLERMKKLDTLVKKVRQIGFQRSIDIVSADYFIKEAELWLAKAKTQEHPVVPDSIPFPFPSGG